VDASYMSRTTALTAQKRGRGATSEPAVRFYTAGVTGSSPVAPIAFGPVWITGGRDL